MRRIRQAKSEEAAVLTDIAVRSEAYWGYDPEFMESFRRAYKVTESFINENPVYVIEEQGSISGFYGVVSDKGETELEYFYVSPDYIGKGLGKLLWTHLVGYCRENGIARISLVTSPQAVGFYTKLGAEQVGEVESLVRKGRMVPMLVCDF
jgi:ribosomal protein S18 acetylase RimI-like enzyme